MQDTHWASGYYGYFPSYAIGNIYSGQILQTIKKSLNNYENKIGLGDFKEINYWLKKNIQNYGNLYDPNELIEKTCGEKITAKPYIKYLDKKYQELFNE